MTFDSNSFMNQTVDQPFETDFALPPEGEFSMMIDDFDNEKVFRTGTAKNSGRDWVAASLPILIQDDKVKEELKRDKVIVYFDVFLDFDSNGALESGPNRNVQLGKLRAAVGQNNSPGWTFAQLKGAGPFLGKIAHQTFNRNDGTTGKKAVITNVAKIS